MRVPPPASGVPSGLRTRPVIEPPTTMARSARMAAPSVTTTGVAPARAYALFQYSEASEDPSGAVARTRDRPGRRPPEPQLPVSSAVGYAQSPVGSSSGDTMTEAEGTGAPLVPVTVP